MYVESKVVLPIRLLQYDKRVVGFSLLLYFVVGSEVSLIHHLGHSLVCASDGFKFDIQFNPFGGFSTCYGIPHNFLLYSILGPAFGGMISGAPLSIPKLRRKRVWLIVLLALFANEAQKIPIEAIVQMPSSIPSLHFGMSLFQYGLLGSLILIIARKNAEATVQRISDHT